MFRITEVNELTKLAPHAAAWRALLTQTPHASFFQSLPWLEAHWKHVGDDRQLRVLLAWNGDELAGILPLNVQHEQTPLGKMRLLTVPTDGWGSFYGPVSADPSGTMTACLDYLHRSRRNFDSLDLRSLPATTVPPAAQNSFSEFNGVAVLDLEGSWESYWESRKQDHNRRRNVERCERRLAELGPLRYVRYRPLGQQHGDAEPRWDLYDACEELARKSWQSGLTNGNTLSHETVRQFVRAAHLAAVDAGALDLNLLFLAERPVAFVYAYHYAGYVDLMRIGFDPELAKLAPGNALWTRLIRDSFARGDRVLDLGPTCLDYKRFWMTRVDSSFRYLHYPPTARSQMLRMARWLKARIKPNIEETNHANKEQAAKSAAGENVSLAK